MEAEIHGIVQRVARGIAVDDERLAAVATAEVGSGGARLARRYRVGDPGVWDRTACDVRLEADERDALEDAEEKAREILRTHAPDPLAEGMRAELGRLVAAADAAAVGGA
jgi:trimethylamine--corrinoid protein Co-methyltransferase